MHRFIALALLGVLSAGCSNADASPDRASEDAAAGSELPTVMVYKTPGCGCCVGWIEHMEAAGFTVDARDVRDLMTVKRDGGVPASMSACHTSLVDGYVVEGHVPAEQIERLLAERPEVAGIAAPGMPIGSPGMEGPGAAPYRVLSFTHAGESAVFAEVDPR